MSWQWWLIENKIIRFDFRPYHFPLWCFFFSLFQESYDVTLARIWRTTWPMWWPTYSIAVHKSSIQWHGLFSIVKRHTRPRTRHHRNDVIQQSEVGCGQSVAASSPSACCIFPSNIHCTWTSEEKLAWVGHPTRTQCRDDARIHLWCVESTLLLNENCVCVRERTERMCMRLEWMNENIWMNVRMNETADYVELFLTHTSRNRSTPLWAVWRPWCDETIPCS